MTANEIPSTDDLFGLLCDARRRHVLAALAAGELPVSVAALAREVVARERETPVDADVLRSIRIGLHHDHLSRLAATDVVEYDPDRHLVREGPHLDVARDALVSVRGEVEC